MKKKNAIWGGALAITIGTVGIVSAMSPLRADYQQTQRDDKDQAKQEKELAELEAQKARLETRIKELRKKSGKTEERSIEIRRSNSNDGGGPNAEQIHKIVEEAMKTAHKAMEEAMKNMPKGNFVFSDDNVITVTPDGKSTKVAPGVRREGQIKIMTDGDSNVFNFNDKMSAEDKAKFKAAMDEMHKSMKNMKFDIKMDREEGVRGLPVAPPIPGQPRIIAPFRTKILNEDDTRSEIKKLHEEVEKLREEVKKQQEKKSGNDRNSTFLEGYS